jgi:two-component SAPR family response regulator
MIKGRYTESKDRKFLLLFIMLLTVASSGALPAGTHDTGLSFRSHETSKEERTSLVLSGDKPFHFGDYFSLEFDLKLRPGGENYGYIVEALLGGNSEVEMMLSNFPYPQLNYHLLHNKSVIAEISGNDGSMDFFSWNHFKLEFVRRGKSLEIWLNGVKATEGVAIPKNRSVEVIFGADYGSKRVTYDVAPVIIKNICVSRARGKHKYCWPLDVYYKDECTYDVISGRSALVVNPDWAIDNHIKWHHEIEMTFDSKLFFVQGAGTIAYFVTRDKVLEYDFSGGMVASEHIFSPALPVKQIKNQFIYDVPSDKIVLYDTEQSDHKLTYFDFTTNRWSWNYTRRNNYTYLHHNKLFSPVDSTLLQLFGYGLHRYRSDMYRISQSGEVSHADLSRTIPPRYLSSVGIADTVIYIYGGVGNQSGKQEFGSEIYNDMYRMDLRTFDVEKLWSLNTDGNSEVASGRLLTDSLRQSALSLFYCPSRYSTRLVLKEMDLESGDRRILADSIPYKFHDTSSSADLVDVPELGKMFAVTSHQADDGAYIVNIYSILSPAVDISGAVLDSPRPGRGFAMWLIVGCAVLAGVVSFIVGRRRRTGSTKPIAEEAETGIIHGKLQKEEKRASRRGIFMLGNFHVVDSRGTDITREFSPTMKQILILIILYTHKNGKGVSNARLKEYFWYDKPEESTRNNRNVNIRKIRLLLESMGGFAITTEGSYWKIEYTTEDAYCDWTYAVDYLSSIDTRGKLSPQLLKEVTLIASRGPLLPNTIIEWLDQFKAAYSDLVIGVLGGLRNQAAAERNPEAVVSLSDSILIFDSLDEDSVRMKCIALVELGRIGVAKKSFDSFVREYRNVMGEEYAENFEKFIQSGGVVKK